MIQTKIKSFTDLNAWQEAHSLTIAINKITKEFPKEEIYGLTSQMRRCAVSISSNIAEGFSRQTSKDKLRFYSIAQGSITELQSQILIARDVGYMTNEDLNVITLKITSTHKLLNGLKRHLLNTKHQILDTKYQILNTKY